MSTTSPEPQRSLLAALMDNVTGLVTGSPQRSRETPVSAAPVPENLPPPPPAAPGPVPFAVPSIMLAVWEVLCSFKLPLASNMKIFAAAGMADSVKDLVNDDTDAIRSAVGMGLMKVVDDYADAKFAPIVASYRDEIAVLKGKLNAQAARPGSPMPPEAPAPPATATAAALRVIRQLGQDSARNASSTTVMGNSDVLAQFLAHHGDDLPDRKKSFAQHVGGVKNVIFVTNPDPARPLRVINIVTRTPEQAARLRAALRQEFASIPAFRTLKAKPTFSRLQLAHRRLVYEHAKEQQKTDAPKIFWRGHEGGFNYESYTPSAAALASIAKEIPEPRPPRAQPTGGPAPGPKRVSPRPN